MRLTVGPLPPAVYWRRRAIVLGAVLVALFLVAQACMSASASPDNVDAGNSPSPAANGPSTPAAAPQSDPPASAPATTTAPESPAPPPADPPDGEPAAALDPADPEACTDEEMLITAETEDESFPGGTSVQFTIRIENDSDRSCRRDVGGDHRELYLRKGTGATKLWSSRDCGGPSGSQVEELAPGFERSHFIVWHGDASDSCQDGAPDGEPVPPGDYQLIARLGTAYSKPVQITVT
ncbi:MAG: hypothetical protein ACRDT2_19445 [Natronosporangium sp.]